MQHINLFVCAVRTKEDENESRWSSGGTRRRKKKQFNEAVEEGHPTYQNLNPRVRCSEPKNQMQK